jgi:hypothetical protein
MKKIIIGGIIIAVFNVNAQTYNPQKAAEYASFWCDKHNDETSPFYDQEKWGGPYINHLPNCAAFVSQCLIAGGLDLSLGAYGVPGGTGEVKPDGVIAGASELVLHLSGYQNTNITVANGFNPFVDHDVGDPMFKAKYSTGIAAEHSMICSSLNGNAKRLYSAHSADDCNEYWPNNYQTERLIFFHIKSSIPNHCDDCEKNHGEEGIDCGGPCPPCEHAPDRVIIDSPTSDLPANVRAIEEITAGNAAVKVLLGQNVNFTSAGTIRLLPGFEAQAGSNFNAQIKGSILGVTADCNKFCPPIYYTAFNRFGFGHLNCGIEGNQHFCVQVANVNKIEYEFIHVDHCHHKYSVYSNSITNQESHIVLWDLFTGEKPAYLKEDGSVHYYYFIMIFYPCQGGKITYSGFILVVNGSPKSIDFHYDGTNEIETPNPLLSPPPNTILLQDENTTPSFVIIPNPNPGTFQIETNFPLADITNLKITNLLGVPVYETQNVVSNEIQLQNSISGLHFVVILLKDGTMLTQKMMLQR